MITGHRIVQLFQFRRGIASSHSIERSIAVISALVLILGAVACGKQGAGWQGTIQVENGVTTVENPAQGIWDLQGRPGLSLIKERQIGALDGPAELTFAGISDIAVNNNGEIYIADRRLAEIRKFDKDGKCILTFGRKGQGPGEFQSIRLLSIAPSGEVIVYDDMLGRISIFADTGELRTTTKKLLETEWISAERIFCSDSGYILFGKVGEGLPLFHEFGEDWSFKGSFIAYEPIDNKDFETAWLNFSPGYCDFQGSGDILYTKPFHDNRLLHYQDRKLTRIIERRSDIKKPYEVEIFRDVQKAMGLQRQRDFASFGRGVAYLGLSFLTSRGVFRMPSGEIVNFISIRKGKEPVDAAIRKSKNLWDLAVELYDSAGRLLSHTVLGPDPGYDIRRMDPSGLFYAVEQKDFPKVVIFRLKY
jgi:hypothetical protein